VVSYLQLAHNERHPVTGASTAKVIHNFGRADQVDRDALSRLVASISRLLTPEQAAALKPRITAEISAFVQRSFAKPAPRPLAPLKPSPSPRP